MGVGYSLVNQTKKESVDFLHLPVNTKREIAGNPVSAAMVSWYMLENQGDDIQFISDAYGEWPFKKGKAEDCRNYFDVTDKVIAALIDAGILKDDGIEWADEDEPETVYIRAIRNVWLDE